MGEKKCVRRGGKKLNDVLHGMMRRDIYTGRKEKMEYHYSSHVRVSIILFIPFKVNNMCKFIERIVERNSHHAQKNAMEK